MTLNLAPQKQFPDTPTMRTPRLLVFTSLCLAFLSPALAGAATVFRAGAATSELAIFAALDIAAGPVATVHVPFRVPSGFHCNFYAADSMLYRQALGTA